MVGNKSCVDGLNRGAWQPHEDLLLKRYIEANGVGRWSTLPARAGLNRCGKSCRLRWLNYLRPNVKRGHISPDEEELIIRLHKLLGNRWSLIAARVPGRTDNDVKNFWNIHVSKKLPSKNLHLKAPRSQVTDISCAESEQSKYVCDDKPAETHKYACDAKPAETHKYAYNNKAGEIENALYETRVVEKNGNGIQGNISESRSTQGVHVTASSYNHEYHSDFDPFWLASSLPCFHGDKLYVVDNTCYFAGHAQPNNLVSHLDLKGMWCNNIF